MNAFLSILNSRRFVAGIAVAVVVCACAIGCASILPSAGPVQHRFLACDFWKKKLWYVDQAKPEANWSVDLPVAPMDVQLVGGNRVLVSLGGSGYGIFDLGTRKMVEIHNPKEIAGSVSARRLADGRTMVGINRGNAVVLAELDAAGKFVRDWSFPGLSWLRAIRQTPGGNWLLSDYNSLVEVTLADGVAADKRIVHRFPLPRPRNTYMGVRLADGRTLVGGGYAAGLFEYDTDGKLTREMVAQQPQGLVNYFYGSVQVLKNGNIAVANWTGHAQKDYHPGWKAVEFDQAGKVTWHWYEGATDVGTINAILILDGLDTGKFNGEAGDGK